MTITKKKNRDIIRQNKATSVVDATIFSEIALESISTITKICDVIQKETPNEDLASYIGNILESCRICHDSSRKAQRLFMRCSTYIKLGAKEIAHNEYAFLKRSVKFREVDDLKNEMEHYHDCMLPMQQSLFDIQNKCSSSSTNDDIVMEIDDIEHIQDFQPQTVPPHQSSQPVVAPKTTFPYQQHSSFIISHMHKFKLPSPLIPGRYYSPIEAVLNVTRFADNKHRIMLDLPPKKQNGKMQTRRTSENTLISMMILKGYIPVNKITMYALIKEYRSFGRLKFKLWKHRNKTGPKPLLPKSSIDLIVSKHKTATDGGCASSRPELELDIKDEINKEISEKPGIQLKKHHIPQASMSRTVNRVMALQSFNVMDNVSNKTESRTAAEFSVRSTIAYMMVVLSTHFINAPPSEFHCRHKDIKKDPVYILLAKLNSEALGYKLSEDQLTELTYVLPNLITSTDECSLFITNQVINNKVSWYFMIRPNVESQPANDSNRRDCFTTKLAGDSHLRGLRITLNNTFTAGGRCAPIFACVFGLKAEEMPHDEIVVCRVKGLVSGSCVTGSMQEGFILFIRGKYETPEQREHEQNTSQSIEDATDITEYNNQLLSKESRVAKIYREQVYYPFIRDIRTNDYDMSTSTTTIPSNLTAVSWMDGCHGQLKLTTSESVLDTEKNLKIITCKHSAARTATEQAADVGPMFKMMKSTVKKMPSVQYENSPIYLRLTKALNELETPSVPGCGRVVILPKHKRSAIIVGLSKLPIAMTTSFTSPIIQSAFRDNGQLDAENQAMPNVKSLIGTYRGSIDKEHYLNNTEKIIKTFYNESFMTGRIEESSFDREGISVDTDSKGNTVSRDFGISKENCQRAKILSCATQRQARETLRKAVIAKEEERKVELADKEGKKYNLNKDCQDLIQKSYYRIAHMNKQHIHETDTIENRKLFIDLLPDFTIIHFGKHEYKGLSKITPTCDHLKAFLQVRQKITKYKAGAPYYDSLNGIKKDKLIEMCFKKRNTPIQHRQFPPTNEEAST